MEENGRLLTVVIPAFNEEQTVSRTVEVISGLLEGSSIPYELILIDDGSTDSTWEKVCEAGAANPKVRGISLSRNFGKESAIFAGLTESSGACTAVIDCDLQHPPEKLIDMYRLWEQGYEIVEGVKNDRGKESGSRRLGARIFYSIISSATQTDMSHASDYKLLDRKAVNALINIPEKNAFFRAMSTWVGFKTASVTYDVQERSAGTSKWSTKKLTRYAAVNLTSFSNFPMKLVMLLGVILFVVCAGLAITALVQKFMGIAVEGFTTVIILQCFTSSLIMMSLGIIGYYISRIFDEIKGRPRYIIDRRTEECGEETSVQ